jgi:hypothetical protein
MATRKEMQLPDRDMAHRLQHVLPTGNEELFLLGITHDFPADLLSLENRVPHCPAVAFALCR